MNARLLSLIFSVMLASCATSRVPAGPVASQVPPDIQTALVKLGPVIQPAVTGALYRPLHAKEPYTGTKVVRSQAYGPDPRHLLDVFTPSESGPPRPVLVFVHGGAFMGGDRRTGDSPFYDNVMLWAVSNGMGKARLQKAPGAAK